MIAVKKWFYILMILMILVLGIGGCQNQKYGRIDLESLDQTTELRIASDDTVIIEQELSTEPESEVDSEEEQQKRKITLLFSGDVLLSSHVLNAYEQAGGIHGVLDVGYRDEIRNADFFMVNQEFPFSNSGIAAADKEYTFRLAPEKVRLFQEMEIDAVTLANNHALDFGKEALLDSCEVLDGAGILHTGAGADLERAKEPVFFEQDGLRIGMIGATRVIPEAGWAAGNNHPGMLATYDPAVLLKEISELRTTCDYVIVYVHWGIERAYLPQEYQRTLGKQYIEAGADLVIGSHPHVLQGVEYYQGKPIVYSLGNFVFGSSIPQTALLKVVFTGEEYQPTFQLIPGTSSAGYTRMITDPDKLAEFYQQMQQISFGVSYGDDGTFEVGS